MKTPPDLRVLYLSRVRQNPYVKLLAAGVEAAGANRQDGALQTRIAPDLSWQTLLRFRPHILHLHWAELQYQRPTARQAAQALRWLLGQLRFAQLLGMKLVYTVHNLSQHEGRYPEINESANQWLFAHADAIHVHDQATADLLTTHYPRSRPREENLDPNYPNCPNRVHVIPHGNYLNIYPDQMDRATARQRLGLRPEHYVYLCLGQIRPYKGIERLIQAFTADTDANNRLIIAGNINVPEYGRHIHTLADPDPRILMVASYIADHDVQIYFNAADACVLPYRRVTTSGAALLAFSFGKPVVAPALGPFPDLISPTTGVLFDPESGDLTSALQRVRQLDASIARSATLELVADRDWITIGGQHAALYRSLWPNVPRFGRSVPP